MPWTVQKPPKVALNWSESERRRCVAAANAVLAEGGDNAEERAIFACIHAAGRSKASAEEDSQAMPEHKIVPFELTKVDTDGRTFEGYASTFRNPEKDQPDLTGDMVVSGAFKKSLAERGGKVRMLWQHDPSQPIGKFQELREDQRGLYVKGVVSDTRLGRDCLALLKDRAIDSMSIGYDALPGGTEYVKMAGGKSVRLLKEIRLWEVSLVTFPADEQAKVTAVKQPAEGPTMPAITQRAFDQARSRVGTVVDQAIEEALTAICTARLLSATQSVEPKAGRRLSAATLSKIEAAMAALRDLMGEMDMSAQADDEEPADTPKATNPPAQPATEPTEQAGLDSQPEQKAGPGTEPPTAQASAAEAAGPDVTPPTSSEASDPGDPFADLDRQEAEVKTLIGWR
jgi:hypothetical protein